MASANEHLGGGGKRASSKVRRRAAMTSSPEPGVGHHTLVGMQNRVGSTRATDSQVAHLCGIVATLKKREAERAAWAAARREREDVYQRCEAEQAQEALCNLERLIAPKETRRAFELAGEVRAVRVERKRRKEVADLSAEEAPALPRILPDIASATTSPTPTFPGHRPAAPVKGVAHRMSGALGCDALPTMMTPLSAALAAADNQNNQLLLTARFLGASSASASASSSSSASASASASFASASAVKAALPTEDRSPLRRGWV